MGEKIRWERDGGERRGSFSMEGSCGMSERRCGWVVLMLTHLRSLPGQGITCLLFQEGGREGGRGEEKEGQAH